MTPESNASLLQAYKYAVEAGQDGIADLLESVILSEMDGERPNTSGFTYIKPQDGFGISVTDTIGGTPV